jgi:ParB-like chromosome segregation protein Spo0J
MLPIADIDVDVPYEPHDHTAKAKLAGLTTAVIAHGLLSPLRVSHDGARYRLLDGAKRLRACADAGVVTVPVEIDHA